jgi:hypothetical protein
VHISTAATQLKSPPPTASRRTFVAQRPCLPPPVAPSKGAEVSWSRSLCSEPVPSPLVTLGILCDPGSAAASPKRQLKTPFWFRLARWQPVRPRRCSGRGQLPSHCPGGAAACRVRRQCAEDTGVLPSQGHVAVRTLWATINSVQGDCSLRRPNGSIAPSALHASGSAARKFFRVRAWLWLRGETLLKWPMLRLPVPPCALRVSRLSCIWSHLGKPDAPAYCPAFDGQ